MVGDLAVAVAVLAPMLGAEGARPAAEVVAGFARASVLVVTAVVFAMAPGDDGLRGTGGVGALVAGTVLGEWSVGAGDDLVAGRVRARMGLAVVGLGGLFEATAL